MKNKLFFISSVFIILFALFGSTVFGIAVHEWNHKNDLKDVFVNKGKYCILDNEMGGFYPYHVPSNFTGNEEELRLKSEKRSMALQLIAQIPFLVFLVIFLINTWRCFKK